MASKRLIGWLKNVVCSPSVEMSVLYPHTAIIFHCPKTRVVNLGNRVKDEFIVISGFLTVPMMLGFKPKGLFQSTYVQRERSFLWLGLLREGGC